MNKGLVTVFGGTGNAGGGVVRQMLEAGWKVRAVTRDKDSDKAKAIAGLGTELAVADMDDRASLRAVIEGSDAVYFSGPSLLDRWDIGQASQGINAVDAVREVGTGHFIYQSAQAADSEGVLSVGSKRAVEARIAEVELGATILRPAWFMDNLLTYFPVTEQDGSLVVAMALPSDRTLAMVSVEDIGRAAAAVFAAPEQHRDAVIDLVADTASPSEMAAEIGESVGKPAMAVEVPMEAIEEAWPQGVGLYRWLATKAEESDTKSLKQLVGTPISFKDFVTRAIRPSLVSQ